MLSTVFSLAIAILVLFYPRAQDLVPNDEIMAVTMIVTATLFIILVTLAHAFSWTPLQHNEQNLTPRLIRLFRADTHIKHPTYWLFLFSLFTYMLAIGVIFSKVVNPLYLLAGWFLILGVSIDSLHHLLRRINSYLDPLYVVDHLSDQAQQQVRDNDSEGLCDSLEAMMEIAVKAVEKTLPSLCNEAVDNAQLAIRNYLEAAKSVSHTDHQANGHGDQVSFTLFYLFQRLELVYNKALEAGLEPICSHIITSLGKMTIDTAKLDLSLVNYPVHYIGKFAFLAQEYEKNEIAEKANCTLLEVSKIIIKEIDLQYFDLKEPFFSIIYQLDEIAKETFRQHRDIQLEILEQPFRDLREQFNNERVAGHQDTPAVIADIDRVLAQFAELALVLRTLPPLPEVPEESTVPSA